MACLRAAGVLEQATGFPGELDLDALAAGPARQLEGVLQFNAVREAATAIGDDELVAAASEALRADLAALPAPAGPGASFRSQHTTLLDLAQVHGRVEERGPWTIWTERVLAVIDDQPREGVDDEAYLRSLRVAAAQPLPELGVQSRFP